MTPVGLGDSFYLHVGTSSASTGAATNADSTPTVTIEEDGVAMGYSPTVANVSTGLYRVTIDATAGNGFEAGKRYSAYVSATVGGINGKDGIGEFEVLATDLNAGVASVAAAITLPNIPADWITAAGIAAGAITSSEAPALANLDAAVSTRLATAGYTAPDNATISLIAGYTDSIEGRLPAALVGGRMDASIGAAQTDTLTASALAADAVAEIQSGLATQADQAAIKAKTDQLVFTVANQVDANVQAVNDTTVTGNGQPGTEWGPA